MDTFSRDVCALSSVDGNNQSALMNAARNLAGAFTDLLNIARPGSDEVWPTTTHTHTFNGPFSGTTRVSQYQKGKTNLDFAEARDSEWQWHQLGHTQVCT